jgi:peptidyl-prolyl cis-trans isomerase D
MRSKAAGLVVKILFAILILSFAVWGIGDYAFLRQGDPTALRVGSTTITASALGQEYRNELERLRRAFGQLDPEMARQFGLIDQVVQRLVTRTVLDQAAASLGVRVGDDVARSRIAGDADFRTAGGEFDRARFQQFLFQSGTSEGAFVALFKREMARSIVTDAVSAGARPPDALVDRLYRYRNEKRAGEMVFVPTSGFADVGTPDDAQLQSVYDDNRERFTAPEYRTLTVVRVGPEEIKAQIEVGDRQIEDEFRTRLAELRTPERREIEQLLFADEAKAKEAQAKIAGGAGFADVGTEAGQPAEQQKLGAITRDDLVPELAEIVFGLPANRVSAPARSPFGWHLFRVTKIQPGHEPKLAEVKERLTQELRAKLAADAAYDHATKLEDALAGGAKLEEAAAKAGVPAVKVAAVDLRGQAPDGALVAVLAGAREAITAAFETASGRETQLTEGREGVWFLIRVDGVTPSAVKPFADVRDEAVKLWQQEKREEAARQRAEGVLAEVTAGKTLEVAAAPFDLKIAAIAPTPRAAGFDPRAAVPPEVSSRLFSLKPNEAAVVVGRDGVYVVRLTEVVPADPAADAAGVAQLREQLQQQMSGDLVNSYAEALRQRYGVRIDQGVVDRVM